VTAAGIAFGAGLTALGLLPPWCPALDIVNNGLPFLLAGSVLLLALSASTRSVGLIAASIALFAVNLWIGIAAMQDAAPQAAPGSERFLRVVTFNLWGGNERMDEVAKFLAKTDADVVVLQEVTRAHGATLRQALRPLYSHAAGDAGLVILSKHPILAEGRHDRPGFPPWISLMLRWVRIDVKGTSVEVAGVHLARPFYPELQEEDIEALIEFAASRGEIPLIVAGDFNMSPWTEKLGRLIHITKLRRYNDFHLTWPMRRGDLPLLPLVAIDNVLASSHFAKIAVEAGPPLGSDHRLVVADLALAGPGISRGFALPDSPKRAMLPVQEDKSMILRLLPALLAALLWSSPALAAAESSIEVWKSATCKCCFNWVKHLEANGFAVKVNAADPSTLDRLKAQFGVGEKLASCHTAKIGPYVIEGHVPAPDIKRLVAEQPNALGLTVPGMPVGSPGMEQGAETEPYDVLLMQKDGTTEVFASH
jgi:endonuclease/exonuclease/phosphatase (EEP) superfamily protein YafD